MTALVEAAACGGGSGHSRPPRIGTSSPSPTREVAYTGWKASRPGDRALKRELRSVLQQFGLPVTGELFDRAYFNVRENY